MHRGTVIIFNTYSNILNITYLGIQVVNKIRIKMSIDNHLIYDYLSCLYKIFLVFGRFDSFYYLIIHHYVLFLLAFAHCNEPMIH